MIFGILSNIAGNAIKKVDRMIEDPIGESIRTVTQPIVDVIDVIDGLTEGELRLKAAARLGTGDAEGMALEELIDRYKKNK